MREANKPEQMEPWFGYLKLLLSALFKIPSEHRLIWRGIKGYISNAYNTENQGTWWSLSSCTESVPSFFFFFIPREEEKISDDSLRVLTAQFYETRREEKKRGKIEQSRESERTSDM